MDPAESRPVNKAYLRDLSPEDCWSRLGEAGIGRVAMCTHQGPLILPVNYLVDAGTVIFRTAPYTQLAAHVDETLAFEVDDFEPDMRRGWSVLVVGRAEALDDPDELAQLRAAQRLEPWAPGSRNLFVRITPTQLTGRHLH